MRSPANAKSAGRPRFKPSIQAARAPRKNVSRVESMRRAGEDSQKAGAAAASRQAGPGGARHRRAKRPMRGRLKAAKAAIPNRTHQMRPPPDGFSDEGPREGSPETLRSAAIK